MPIDPAPVAPSLRGRHLLVCVSGGIAAYKTADWVSQLVAAGIHVRVAMTSSAEHFVGAATFFGLTGNPVFTELFAPDGTAEPHVWLGDWAELILVAPATANVISRIASGEASDIVTATLLASRCPIVVAPAMSDSMWEKASVQENVAALTSRGITVVHPDSGRLASGHAGLGRLASASAVFDAVELAWKSTHDLSGVRVVVSAGGTREPIDPVRYIGNYSSGKMGFAIAQAAADRGAEVVLVSTAQHQDHVGIRVVYVETAEQMMRALTKEMPGTAMLVMTAAVADYRPEMTEVKKIKRGQRQSLDLRLTQNPDIAATLTALPSAKDTVTLGFAAEDADLLPHAQEKLAKKGFDAIFVNDISRDDIAMGSEYNAGTLVFRSNQTQDFPRQSKRELADHLINAVKDLLGSR